ncbi:hypothetical protein [Gehongia tenuis]|uniref:DUF1795 domain-containing protein n=1 Tax=Gehongia tenuis TaxID=2763655 RepID=A0A926HK38_9FIRM|nr:hypothetical protein [Gehongia tenuis]MBC8530552.1 hypothetical protein [Gehongia tenuis]
MKKKGLALLLTALVFLLAACQIELSGETRTLEGGGFSFQYPKEFMVEKASDDAPDKIQMRYMVGGEMYLCTVMPHEEGKKLADLDEAGRQEVVDILVDNMEAQIRVEMEPYETGTVSLGGRDAYYYRYQDELAVCRMDMYLFEGRDAMEVLLLGANDSAGTVRFDEVLGGIPDSFTFE